MSQLFYGRVGHFVRRFAGIAAFAVLGHATFAASAASTIRIVPGLEEPLIAMNTTTVREDRALDAAIEAYQRPTPDDASDFAVRARPLEVFLDANNGTAWRTAVLTDLGLGYYRAGYFSRATAAFEQAWIAGRGATEPRAKAMADRAFGELVRMHARVGHADALERLFADAGDRPVTGAATELVAGAREGLWMFRNDWGTAYLCGPKALRNLLVTLKADPAAIAAIDAIKSGPNGFTFAEVAELATQAGLKYRLVARAPNQPVPVPSVVNWKMNHYAAIVGEADGRYHIKDPTFGGGDLWISKAAIDAESSGYYLVPAVANQSLAWRDATIAEARSVYGMGFTGNNQPGATTPCDMKTTPADGPSTGMCTANATSMVVSLNLNDAPVGYSPQKGPSAVVRLSYNQREAYQPTVFGFFNVGQKWTLNLLSWVQDNPTAPGQAVYRYVAGGGAVDYTNGYSYSSSTGAFSPERQGQAVLVRIPATGAATSYELRRPDGSKQVFARPDTPAGSAVVNPRKFFLTQIVDPAGNALTLNYDATLRLTAVNDATGRNTTFGYDSALSPLLVTRITDPFGRSATLAYDTAGRLASITDVLGITSSFTYDSSGLVNAMTTPYGTSRFVYGQNTGENSRFLESTDPMGFTERVEFRHQAAGMPYGDPVYPSGWNNDYLYYRNTFHWDKHTYPITHTDYTRARITHWLHNPAGQTSPIVESVKLPLERRVWLKYPGQGTTYYEGTTGTPIQMARVLDDGTTQSHSFTYNAFGKPLTSTDPVGRRTVFTYDVAGVDLLKVEQQTSTGGALSAIASFTYNGQHLPLSYTNAAGQVTRYTYNAAGQPLSVTDALNQTSSFAYDGFGRLIATINASGAVQQSRTYDAYDRVATSTDSEGHTLSYSYDALDRVTQIAYPDGTATRYAYNRLDLAGVTDRLGRMTSYAHDANRRMTAVTDPLGQTTGYGYYENGVLASLTDAKGNTTRWDIDLQSRPTAKRYANGNVETYSYESSTSRPKAMTDPMGQVKTFGYTRDDRVSALTYTNTIRPTPNVAFNFDAFFPRPTAMTDGIGTTTFQYQPVGAPGALQLAVEDGPYGNDAIAYAYDALGRVVMRTVDSTSETFAYDRLGRTAAHSSALGAFTRSYLGQTAQLTSQLSSTGVGTSWSYDTNTNDRRLTAVANSGQARSFGFATTPENRITGILESVGGVSQKSWTYAYDNLDRLASAQPSSGPAFSYGYDAADNLTANNGVAATFNAANQLTSFGGTSLTYDANGNLTDDGARTFQWDAENRMVGIGYKAQPGQSTAIRYDGMGRRLSITDSSSLGATETRHLWCGEMLCQGRSASDQITRRYFAEGVVIPQSGQSLYYGTDQLGSVRDLLAMQNGSKVAGFDYEPYGSPSATTGRVSSEFRYAGLYLHGQSGLYLANYRAYNPRSAQWLSRDPITEEGGPNLYGYVSGNPITRADSTGQLFGLDNLVEGAVSVIIGKVVASATGDDYTLCDAAWDFATGALTSGLSNINKLRKLGRVAEEGIEAAGKAGRRVEGAVDDIAKAESRAAEGTTGKATGTYTNVHESGTTYHGKGTEDRMRQSARDKAREHNDPVVSSSHTPAPNAREAFKEEARRIEADGGPGRGNYNKINSPGKKYREQDGD